MQVVSRVSHVTGLALLLAAKLKRAESQHHAKIVDSDASEATAIMSKTTNEAATMK